jgi:hypothetical protein
MSDSGAAIIIHCTFLLANLTTFVTRYNGSTALLKIAQSPEFAASFLTHISTSITPTFFPLAGTLLENGYV